MFSNVLNWGHSLEKFEKKLDFLEFTEIFLKKRGLCVEFR